jgi:hypothetical protein
MTPVFLSWDSERQEGMRMSGERFSPGLAVLSACIVLFFWTFPEALIGLIAYAFIVGFIVLVILGIPAFFVFDTYMLYQLLKGFWRRK